MTLSESTQPSLTSDLPSTHTTVRTVRRPLLVLGVVLLATYAINLDTTIVNVALPSLDRALHTSTSELQWVVDGYNLAFAALVLAGGNLGDRFGRRRVLVIGLGAFALASLVSAAADSAPQLIALRFLTGAGAALIFPTTLSIISNTFPDRNQRARAIGLWGAVTGLGVATGPIVGGALLEHFWSGSVFLGLVPIALVAMVGAATLVPPSRDLATPPLDRGGLLLSVVAVGGLVYSIIEAPARGWGSAGTIVGLVVSLTALAVLVRYELRHPHPMLDARLFTNLRFSAACAAVTVAFFALFGFIFLVSQFFQVIRGYGPLETGVRMLPVAMSIAVTSLLGTWLATVVGNKIVVSTGLLLLCAAFGWIASVGVDTNYTTIVGQMIVLGCGLGLTSAPATEAIMGVVRPEQAGAGSAVNDATREFGGTLGVAVLGSIYASVYAGNLVHSKLPDVPANVLAQARTSLAAGEAAARQATGSLPAATIADLRAHIEDGFMHGFHVACITASVICLVAAAVVAWLLPSHAVTSLADGND